MNTPDQRVVIELRITEYVDGHMVNDCKLKKEGTQSYLETAERVLHALGPAKG